MYNDDSEDTDPEFAGTEITEADLSSSSSYEMIYGSPKGPTGIEMPPMFPPYYNTESEEETDSDPDAPKLEGNDIESQIAEAMMDNIENNKAGVSALKDSTKNKAGALALKDSTGNKADDSALRDSNENKAGAAVDSKHNVDHHKRKVESKKNEVQKDLPNQISGAMGKSTSPFSVSRQKILDKMAEAQKGVLKTNVKSRRNL